MTFAKSLPIGALHALRRPAVAIPLLMLVFWACAMRHVELPGLYMDAINPDYLAARWLQPELPNAVWTMPGPELPILGNLYHGTQNLYVGLLTYGVLGTGVTAARISHALFGCAIVLLVFLVARRLTGRPLIALLAAAGLATDMAFLGSFRTQSYIIMGGQAWMLGGMLLALRAAQAQRQMLVLLASGACMGLAVYGYFVHLFYAPVVAAAAILANGRAGVPGRAAAWSAGFALGLLPYVIGYGWAMASLGGWTPFVEWLQQALASVKPMGDDSSYPAGLSISLRNLRLAMGGLGNEMMMTGEAVSVGMDAVRLALLAAGTLVCLAAATLRWASDRVQAWHWICVALLAPAYLLVAGVFGERLWVHHFTVLVAAGYLVMAVALSALFAWLPRPGVRVVAGFAIACLLLATNLQQQNRFFAALAVTGGVGKSTEMLEMLARSALAERHHAVYYFPEWGFFMPFAFLTGNQVRYELELTPSTIGRFDGAYDELRVVFWEAKDRPRYEALLRDSGIGGISLYTFAQRDGKPAFHLLAGRRERL